MYPLYTTLRQLFQSTRNYISSSQGINGSDEHPRDIERDVSLADNDGFIARQVRREIGEFGQAIVPSHELSSRINAFQGGLPRNSKLLVLRRSISKEYRIIVVHQGGERDGAAIRTVTSLANRHISDKGEVGGSSNLLKFVLAILGYAA